MLYYNFYCGGAIERVGAVVHVPPVSVTHVTDPLATVAVAVGFTVQPSQAVTVTIGVVTYPDQPLVTVAVNVVPERIAVAVALTQTTVTVIGSELNAPPIASTITFPTLLKVTLKTFSVSPPFAVPIVKLSRFLA